MMRFLCLHGLGTNSEVLEAQTASLRYQLGEGQHEFDFPNGSLLWPPARGIQEVFGQYIDCYSYFDADGHSASSIRGSVEELADYVKGHGPFDGVVGFSQGAVLAATLIIAVEKQLLEMEVPFKCAVFLCGGLPFDFAALRDGEVKLLETDGKKPLIHLPTTNAWASNDIDYPGMGPPLSQMCSAENNQEVVHTAGHGVPAEGEELARLVEAVRATIKIAAYNTTTRKVGG